MLRTLIIGWFALSGLALVALWFNGEISRAEDAVDKAVDSDEELYRKWGML